jgi:glycogen(starch) synthase
VVQAVRKWLPAGCRLAVIRFDHPFTGWLSPEEVVVVPHRGYLVVPSWYEPFGMVILEGMLYGLAVGVSRGRSDGNPQG